MAPKRKAPETPETAALQRRSTRISSSAKKSRYFEDNSEDTVSQEEHTKAKSSAKRMPFRISAGSKLRIQESEDDDDDRDVLSSSSSEDDSLPPKVTYTPLPKLRPTDGIPYTPSRLHKNTLLFLSDLKANNKRPWLKSHDAEFRRALDDFNAYIASLTPKLIALDDTLPDLPLKDIIFRIYRDTRFSKDPTPYKPHFSAAWSRTGRKGPYAVYYLHVQPGEASFLGGGVFHPPAGPLAKVRASIDERPGRWRRVLGEEGFRRTFLGGVDEEGAVGEFVKRNREGALKTKPKGFNADHRDIELLKLKSFTVMKKLPDSVFTAEDGQDEVARIFGDMVGFITHLNSIVMPDPGQDDDSEDEEDEDEEEQEEDDG